MEINVQKSEFPSDRREPRLRCVSVLHSGAAEMKWDTRSCPPRDAKRGRGNLLHHQAVFRKSIQRHFEVKEEHRSGAQRIPSTITIFLRSFCFTKGLIKEEDRFINTGDSVRPDCDQISPFPNLPSIFFFCLFVFVLMHKMQPV